MRQQLQLVHAVKDDQRTNRPAAAEQRAQPLIGEHALDEVLAQRRIVQAPFLFDRQIRHRADERLGEQPAARAGDPAIVVHTDALESAAGRILLQDVAGEIRRLQLAHARRRRTSSSARSNPCDSSRPAGAPACASDRCAVAARDEMDRLTRRAHAHFDLRTHRHPLDEAAEGRDEKRDRACDHRRSGPRRRGDIARCRCAADRDREAHVIVCTSMALEGIDRHR